MYNLVPFRRTNNGVVKRDSYFDNFFNDFFSDSFFGSLEGEGIRADVKETENDYVIDAELPGVNKEDISLDIKGENLVIAVNRKQESEEDNKEYIRRELRYDSQQRSFHVGNIDTKDIEAKYDKGILTIKIPKKVLENKNTSKIEIQ